MALTIDQLKAQREAIVAEMASPTCRAVRMWEEYQKRNRPAKPEKRKGNVQ